MQPRSHLALVLGVAASVLVAACASDTPGPTAPGVRGAALESSSCTPDVTPPTISSVTASPVTLWPPNHKYVPVTVTTVASDNCGNPVCALTSATSNEPDNGLGDGNTTNDILITGANTLLVREERSGLGDGRVYTAGVTCTDGAGLASTAFTNIVVPHDQGHGKAKGRG